MVVLGGIVGAIAGFVIGVAVEVTFWNDRGGIADVIPFALAAAGVLAGSALARRYRKAKGA
jgi:hypothetical protein